MTVKSADSFKGKPQLAISNINKPIPYIRKKFISRIGEAFDLSLDLRHSFFVNFTPV